MRSAVAEAPYAGGRGGALGPGFDEHHGAGGDFCASAGQLLLQRSSITVFPFTRT